MGQAREAAGDKDVRIAGCANAIRQAIEAGLVDELQIHLAPVLLGDELEITRVIDSPRVTHLWYRVIKEV